MLYFIRKKKKELRFPLHIEMVPAITQRAAPTTANRAPQHRCRSRHRPTRRRRWRRRRSRVADAHFPARTERRDALRLECLLIHRHHLLLRHALEIRRVFVQPEGAQPPSHVVQNRRVDIFFVLLHAVVPCGTSFTAGTPEARRVFSGPIRADA